MARERQERKDTAQLERERSERVFRDAEMAMRDSKDRAERAELAAFREAEASGLTGLSVTGNRKPQNSSGSLSSRCSWPPLLRRSRRSRVYFR